MSGPWLQGRREKLSCSLHFEGKIYEMGNSPIIRKVFYKVLGRGGNLGNIHYASVLQMRRLRLKS